MRRFVLLAALAAAACDQPPVKEIAAAEQQVALARTAQADRYAPERYTQAEAALETAHTRLRERNYRAALSAANDAQDSARAAVEATGPAKAAVRKDADIAIVEIRTMLDRATAERTEALKAGVPRATLAPLDALGQRSAQKLSEAIKLVNIGNSAFAAGVLADLRTEVTPLPDLFRDTRTTWEAKHPKGAPRRPARRPAR